MPSRRILLLAGLAAAVLATGCASRGDIARLREEVRRVDFVRVITSAKRKVFPVIVYLKPIQETFAGGEKAEVEVIGSGVIISPDGYVVTNYHVAQNATKIRAVLADEKQTSASVVGYDQDTDIALLKLDFDGADVTLPYAEFGDSSRLEEGDFVMTMGCPLGLTRSVSFGVVSNTKRYLGARLSRYNLWIQTDAAINPGNSGGPLVNSDGEIVGINTLGVRFGQSIGFANPSDVVKTVVDELRAHGRVRRAWTGITFQALKDFDSNTIVDADEGVLAADVEPGSPAETAGLKANDLILAVAGEPAGAVFVEDLPALRTRFAALEPDRKVDLLVRRDGRELTLPLTPLLRGKVEGEDFDCKEWQMTIKEINRFADRQMYYFVKRGVYIQGVESKGNARSSLLVPNDIILEIDGRKIESLDDARAAYEELDGKPAGQRRAFVKVLRDGIQRMIALDYNRRDSEYEKDR